MTERNGVRVIERPPRDGEHLRAVHEIGHDEEGVWPISFVGIPVEIA